MHDSPTVLIVPGLRDHVADHWQTKLEAKLSKVASVPPLDHDKLSCAARVVALDLADKLNRSVHFSLDKGWRLRI